MLLTGFAKKLHHKNQYYEPPPPDNTRFVLVPVVHKIQSLYKEVYRIGSKIPKRDLLGLHTRVESVIEEMLSLTIAAAFTPRISEKKKFLLESARLKTEITKQLVRTEYELHIISETSYLSFQEYLQEISKMINGWIGSLPKP